MSDRDRDIPDPAHPEDRNIHVVSVIIPVYNGEKFLDECLQSICNQQVTDDEDEITVHIEVSIFDDGSTDETPDIVKKWTGVFSEMKNFSLVLSKHAGESPKGVGFAKNRAVENASGDYLCFCDADDIMEPKRIMEQLKVAIANSKHDTVFGSKFTRLPETSTRNFTFWANHLTDEQLYTQIFQSFGPTLVMPTWFCHRNVFSNVQGGFDEGGQGVPEDLIFFYKHLNQGGKLHRVNQSLMIYRYHPDATTFSVKEPTIYKTRISQFQQRILTQAEWSRFTIYGAGKLGKRFFRSLEIEFQRQVQQFCDIAPKKVQQKRYEPYPNPNKFNVPIVHYQESIGPYVVCINTEYTWDPDNPFQQMVKLRNLVEGKDFFYFN